MPHSNFSKVTDVTSVTTLFLLEERRFFSVTALNKGWVTTVTQYLSPLSQLQKFTGDKVSAESHVCHSCHR